MSEQQMPQEEFDWKAWTAMAPEARVRGAEVLQRISNSLPLSPREEAIAAYAHERCADYRAMELQADFIARTEIDLMGTFLCAADNTSGRLAEIAQLSDERPPETEAMK